MASPASRPSNGIDPSRRRFLAAAGLAGIAGLVGGPTMARAQEDQLLTEVASFDGYHVTGVAVDGDGRLFVNQPRFPWAVSNQGNRPVDADDVNASVVEVTEDGELVPYPDQEWNNDGYDQVSHTWQDAYDPASHFVNVQSVYIDPDDPYTLWTLDTGNPELSGPSDVVRPAGPKVVQVDTRADEVVGTVFLGDESITPERERQAYLNDVRVTADQSHAFMTDSELGALVVVDLDASDGETAVARRRFDDAEEYPELHAEEVGPTLGPHEGQDEAAGPINGVHADGIAIDPDDRWVYFHALSGEKLYRSRVGDLTNLDRPDRSIRIDQLGPTDFTDGMIADDEGVYHSALDIDAVTRWNYGAAGTQTIAQDSGAIRWPDSFAIGPDRELYVTNSKIHLESGGARQEPFTVLRIDREVLR